MVGHWFQRIFGSEDADPAERGRIAAEHDRLRTDAIISAERIKYGHRLDTPLDRDTGADQDRNR